MELINNWFMLFSVRISSYDARGKFEEHERATKELRLEAIDLNTFAAFVNKK